jgi:hypothetical protein
MLKVTESEHDDTHHSQHKLFRRVVAIHLKTNQLRPRATVDGRQEGILEDSAGLNRCSGSMNISLSVFPLACERNGSETALQCFKRKFWCAFLSIVCGELQTKWFIPLWNQSEILTEPNSCLFPSRRDPSRYRFRFISPWATTAVSSTTNKLSSGENQGTHSSYTYR